MGDEAMAQAPTLFDTLRAGEQAATEQLAGDDGVHDDEARKQASGGGAAPDTGRLPPDARRALVALLKQGVIMAADKRLLYESLCRYRAPITAHLADMYLRMLIDERAGVALIMQQSCNDIIRDDSGDEEDEDISALITRRALSLYDTLLLLVLRKHYQERQTDGANTIHIDTEHIEARLSPFLPLTTSTRNEKRRLSGALDNMVKRKLLARVRGDDERFEITPVITYVVNAPALEHLLAQYEQLVAQHQGGEDRAV